MASRMNAPLVAAFAAAALLGACAKAPVGWSADDKGKTRDLCLTQVGTGIELEQARSYCDCLVAKTIEQYPSRADAELGVDRDGERLGNACAAELGLAGGADAAAATQGQTQGGPRVYGDWQVEFVARGPDADDVDTWQAIGVDEHGAGARLAYICDASGYCGFVFRPATECDPSDAEPAPFVLRFTLANGGAAVSTGGRCLRNGAWALTAADEILDRFRAYPEAVKVGLRGDGWDFSLDGATAAMAYCERAARGERAADDGAAPEPAAPPAR